MENENYIDAPNARPGLKNWIIRLVKGILVGIGAILPGLSGGVLSVIFGIYKPMIQFLSNITHKFIENLKYFIPVGIGGIIGILIFSKFVVAAFGQYEAQFVCLFIGFVIGTFPSLYRTAGAEGRERSDIIIMVLAGLIIFALMFAGKDWPKIEPNTLVWFLSGALVALGFIVPGMSPSNFLIYFGLYDKMAAGISSFDMGMLIPFVLGAIICILLFAKLAAWLFDQYYSKMYHAILGMVIGSSLAIFPSTVFPAYTPEGLAASGLSFPVAVIFGLATLIIGIVASYAFSKVEERVESEEKE